MSVAAGGNPPAGRAGWEKRAMHPNLNAYPALVLNADMIPLCTNPLSVMNWQDAVLASTSGSHDVVDSYDVVVRSPGTTMRLPAVLRVRSYVRLDRPASLSRWNLFLAHGFRCAYCTGTFRTAELTFDHVVPKMRKGLTVWSNLVPACSPCNNRKGDKSPERVGMTLRRKPFHPTCQEVNLAGMRHVGRTAEIRDEWKSWLYWNEGLDP